MPRETEGQLYQAVKSHTLLLEITRAGASGLDLEVLDRRIEEARLLLEWLSQALEIDPRASPAVETPPHHQALKLIRIIFRHQHPPRYFSAQVGHAGDLAPNKPRLP